MIYTTNADEGYYRQVRKVIKTKAVTSDMALLKLDFLVARRIEKKWNYIFQKTDRPVHQVAIKIRRNGVSMQKPAHLVPSPKATPVNGKDRG